MTTSLWVGIEPNPSETRILARHVLRNSIGAALSMTGLQVGLMFSGVLVVEQVFVFRGPGEA